MNSSVLESGYQSQVQQLEKRKVRRLKTRVRVRVQIDYSTKIFETYTYDLSVEGLSFYGNGQLIFPNQIIKFTLFLPESTLIGLTGQVFWNERKTSRRQTGIKFLNTNQKTNNAIDEYITRVTSLGTNKTFNTNRIKGDPA